ETIFGENSPSGSLPVTFYADTKELPDFCDYSMKNRTYRYTRCKVLYPFGYGLSYTDILYHDASINCTECDVKDSVIIKTKVTNKGKYSINESVQ
ncbi:glycoside hydrolase family 3 C-terminal domain-containing protein, partial [Klebsiella pneumoniae]|uniref:glycoside hydrolase family 3 C-terminal domain-containing protein n=1 Tax=Klebsiella pneumoniae TaxID=573 RepID=UPI00200BA1EB